MNEHKLAKLVIDRDKILNDFNKDCKTIKELKDLEKLYKSIYLLQAASDEYYRCSGIYYPKNILSDDIKYINTIIMTTELQLGDNFNKDFIKMNELEEVNGYKLYNLDKNLMNRQTFNNLSKLDNDQTMTDKEFKEWFDENACTDWNKQQPNGEYFGGFWNDKSCSNASVLTRQHNFDELIKLPYSRKLICETIDIGCCNRIESVRFTNYVCEWIKRKKNI